MKEFYNVLKKIEVRPALWTGEINLKSISIFLNGYSLALHEHDILQSPVELEINFHDWIANKLGFYESTSGWNNMILAITIGLNPKNIKWENYDSKVTNEQHEMSIKKFYELLEEFMNE
ncbi:hypothetical protein A9Q86_02940 [Flavobacteriales bacterium 33_180_T64]|nr:hypothetical protein A9Q86_02940 [Flavobacteriales bacterium 33_180_T64]